MAERQASDDSDLNLVNGDKILMEDSSKVTRITSKIQCFVGVISMYILTYITMEMYMVAIITTLEKRFGLRSSQSGVLLSLREGASLATAMLFSHLGRNLNKAKFLSVMGLVGSIGGFLCAVPHFIGIKSPQSQNGHHSQDSTSFLCTNQTNSTTCSPEDGASSHNTAFILLALGSALMGLTSSAHGSLSNTYVDDNSPREKSAFYLGKSIGIYKYIGIQGRF